MSKKVISLLIALIMAFSLSPVLYQSEAAAASVTAEQKVSVKLSKTKYIYDGKNKTPKVTVTNSAGKPLTKNKDYKISVASDRSSIGKYTVKVTLIGAYKGTYKVYFYILPGAPKTVKASSNTTSSVKLSWSSVPGAKGYTVYQYNPAKKAYKKTDTTSKLSLKITSLKIGTSYTFKVIAYGTTSAGKVYNSEKYTLIKTATKPAVPKLTDAYTSSGKIKLKWSNVSGETGYSVYYSESKSNFEKYADFKANSTSCTISLPAGKTHYFKIRAYTKTDSGTIFSAWSNVKNVKIATAYYVTNTGKKYHTVGCSSLSKSKIEIDYSTAIARGYTPCSKCID